MNSERSGVRAARMFDGEVLHEGPVLLVLEAGRIRDVDLTGAPPPRGVELVEFADSTLLPGLVDAHSHLAWDPDQPAEKIATEDEASLLARTRRHAEKALRAGVTTVRDLGDRAFVSLKARNEYRAGQAIGPELLVAGPPITRTGGHCWYLGGEADARDEVVAAVVERARLGVDLVKVMATGGFTSKNSNPFQPAYSLEQLTALVRAAHEHKLRVTAHAHATAGIATAIEAGVDGVEHCTFVSENGVALDPELVETMAAKGIWVGTTIGRERPGRPPEAARLIKQLLPNALELRRRGVPLVLCTDAGINETRPHDVLPSDLVYAAHRGFTNQDVLTIATSDAAASCNVGDRKGRIAPGYDADLIAVPGNPLHRIENLLDVQAVFRGGHRVR
ncbi:hypothetical protein GCM10012275_49480 [Longimycelium tulufanense]|uniref:Amidohydrolase-related domain-containing protein n=1 Tax=Longimycelium tulufanense TaxID=907463 RepID=A0A8J3FYL1_9PSEU|nr:amidohydrolase family protein [Longimycelium tulufanense]GGM72961.1 hypothetical protein GCM10012275_49480 [Longimycelium tulufanense]